jgi:hypothetical protein
VPPASAAGQMAISSSDPVRVVLPKRHTQRKIRKLHTQVPQIPPERTVVWCKLLNKLPKGFAETTCTEWQQECRSAGIYLHFFRLTITQMLACAGAQSMREPSLWLIREKRKVRD